MQIFYSYPDGWYVIVGLILITWLSILLYRKSYKKKKEIRQQIALGFISVAFCAVLEIIGVSTGLWNYAPGNWPIIIWPVYFILGLVGYQIIRLLMEKY